MLTVSDVQALIVITLGDAFVLNRRVRQQYLAQFASDESEEPDPWEQIPPLVKKTIPVDRKVSSCLRHLRSGALYEGLL